MSKINFLDSILRNINGSPSVSEKEKLLLLHHIEQREYKKGDYILKYNQIEDKVSFLLKGKTHQYKIDNGSVRTLNIAFPIMSFCSYISYIKEIPSEQIIQAIDDVSLLYIRKESIEKLTKESPILCYIAYKLLEKVHLEREIRADILQCNSAYSRFEKFVTLDKKASYYLKNVPQKLIASYIGLTPQSFSKAKKMYLSQNSIS